MNTTDILDIVIIAVIAYALGNINPAIVIGRLHGIDIRKEGSGNPGMTNTIRVIGLGAGIAVFAIDMLKGVLAVLIGRHFGADAGAMVGAAFVMLGHCFPALYGFKGGKGVAAAFGAVLAINWQSALLALAVAAVFFLIFRRMSVASMCGAVSYPFFVHHFAPVYTYFGIAAAIFLLVMHRKNIVKLFTGEEAALEIKKKVKDKDGSDDKEV